MGMSLAMGLSLSSLRNGVWSPARLLTGASQLAYYDPSDLSTLFQDSAGTTPVTTDGQSVGLVLDKSQGLTLGAENAVSPAPNTTDWTNTSAGCVVTAGFATWTAAASGARVDPASSGIVVGTTYKVEITIDSISAGAIRLTDSLGTSTNRPDLSTSGTHVFYITAAVNDIRLRSVGATTTAVVSRLSVKALPGNHLIQSTAGSRPLYGFHPATGVRNLLTYTEDFSNAAWVSPSANVTKAVASLTADSSGAFRYIKQDSVLANGQVHSVSGEFTPGTSNFVWLLGQGSANAFALFDVSTGTYVGHFGSGGAPTSTSIVSVGGGWYRISATWTKSTATGVEEIGFGLSDGVNSNVTIGASIGARKLQLELGSPTEYQKVNTANGVTEAGVPTVHFLKFDGADDFLVSAANVNPGSVDKAQVFAGVRKLSDAAVGYLFEFSASAASNDGAFNIAAPSAVTDNFNFFNKGTVARSQIIAGKAAPITAVITALGDISGDSTTANIDGVLVGTNTGDLGDGNYLAYPLYVGRRGGATQPFNGNIYSLIVRFSAANLDAAVIDQAEAWTAGKTGVTL